MSFRHCESSLSGVKHGWRCVLRTTQITAPQLLPCPALTHLPARQRIGVTIPSNRLGRSSHHAARQALLTRLVIDTTPPKLPVNRRTASSSAMPSTVLARTRTNDALSNTPNPATCGFHGTATPNVTRTTTVIVFRSIRHCSPPSCPSCCVRPASWYTVCRRSAAS